MPNVHENGNRDPGADGVLHVAFVLDKSGSMQAVEEAVVAGYNDYLRELRGQGGETLFSLTTFDTRFEHVCMGEPLRTVAELDHRSYRPGGMTALYDAIAHTVAGTDRRLQADGRDGEKVLVVVMTGSRTLRPTTTPTASQSSCATTTGGRTGRSSTSAPATTRSKERGTRPRRWATRRTTRCAGSTTRSRHGRRCARSPTPPASGGELLR